ncbi:MAG: hypothetical protein LBB74_08255, partial [Chitinispirillales bacterium]|nr:hypothetical protein [Chitinispirillales bacterium]
MFALRVRAFLIAAAAAVAAVLCCGCSESGLGGALEERKPLGTFTDERDGTKYHTVKTGGKKWMTENMRYELKKEEGISYCYDYGDCEDGRLYDWDAALNYACPSGWHLASGREWDDLVLAAGGKDEGGKKLKSKSGWKGSGNGTDAYGFAARPGGYRWHIDKKFYGSGSDGNWWTSTATVSVAYSIAMSSGGNEVSKTALDKRAGYSVRCVEGAGGSEYGKWDGAEFGSYIDTRNNDTTRYKTVKMPDGKTWMAENMKHVTKSGSRCYGYGGGDNSNCNQYGRLYDRNAAAEACPTGWHLADKSDWDDLANSVGGLPTAGMSLKTANGWNNSGNGEDNYGFSAQPGGHFTNDSHNIGAAGYWWTSTSTTAGSADRFYKYMEAGKKSLMEGASATDFLSVRCVADDKGNIPTYSITVISDGIEPYSVGRQEVGKMVTIFAGKDPPGWEFKNWESDDVILDDASKTKRSITFAMPANDITLKAMFVPAEISRTVVDKNGQEYEVVKRGDLWWMAKNLNYKIDDGRNSWCYEDDPKNCENYGRLYNWNTANTVCPEGSRLPSRGDWSDLIVYAGGESAAGEKLKAINDWTYSGSAAGRDELLFSALPGGARSPNGKFDGAKNFGYWWTSMGADADTAEFKSMGYDHNGVRSGSSGKNAGYSVRCVLGEASTYSVTVSAGTGASGVGDYRAGETVNITAGKAPEGKRFKKWESDAGVVFNDAFNEATTFAMLAKNVTVTAEFEFIYRVTVKSDGTGKSGDGSYAEGAAVAINAGKAPEGKRFKNWESAAGVNFDDPKSATASFLMPAKDVTVTAAFEPVVIGNLTDYRDKNKYRTVVIDGVEWMAENLRYDAKSSGSQCYNNCESYGMLYSMDSAKTACPDGWRLASKADWDILAESAGGIGKAGKNLKAANDWGNTVNGNGTDAYKFSALPGGYFDKKINDFDSFLKSGYW